MLVWFGRYRMFGPTDSEGKYYTAQLMRYAAFANLNGEFVEVVSTAPVWRALG